MAYLGTDIVKIEAPASGPCPLQHCILGTWDDLSGPGVKCVFSIERDSSAFHEKVQDLAKIALSFHLNDPPKMNYFTVCEFCDMDLSGFNCVYAAQTNNRKCMYCFFCVFPRSYYCVLKSMICSFTAFWEEKIDRVKVFQKCEEFVLKDIVDLYRSCFIPDFCDFLTRFEQNRSFIQHLPLKSYFSAIKFEDKFVQRCIASHLITFGHSLIIGGEGDIEAMNQMICILRLFSLPLQKALCFFVPNDASHLRYHAELMVQGLLIPSKESQRLPISAWDLLRSQYPLTIINVHRRKVKQSVSLLSHQNKRKAFLTASIATFLKEKSTETSDLFTCVQNVKVDGLISDGNVISVEIEKLCSELLVFQGRAELIINYINLFMRQMIVKAKSLIAYASELRMRNLSSISVSVKNLWNELNVSVDSDYMILLALAEELKPGTIRALDRYF